MPKIPKGSQLLLGLHSVSMVYVETVIPTQYEMENDIIEYEKSST